MSELTEAEIIKKTWKATGISKSQMARDMDCPRQRLHSYMLGEYEPSSEYLNHLFLNGSKDYVKEMALEILLRRPENERWCVCLERIGDNGHCPRHAATLVVEEA